MLAFLRSSSCGLRASQLVPSRDRSGQKGTTPPSVPPLSDQDVERDSEDEDETVDRFMPEGSNVEHDQNVGEQAEEEDADEDAEDRSLAAGEAAAAEHAGCDDRHLDAGAGARHRRAEAGRVEDAGQPS